MAATLKTVTMAIAAQHGVIGDIAYGSRWTYNKCEKAAEIAVAAVNGDYDMALAVIEAANKAFAL